MSSRFDESFAKFQLFLKDHGYPTNVVWVTPNDILVSGRPEIYVKVPVPKANEQSVRQLFDLGMSQERGVLFDTICEDKDATFSYAWMPRNDAEAAESLMPKGLKLSAKTGSSRVPARAVASRLRWAYLQMKYRRQQNMKPQLFR
jgi:hypothetical protein